jgi:hypothetical protein
MSLVALTKKRRRTIVIVKQKTTKRKHVILLFANSSFSVQEKKIEREQNKNAKNTEKYRKI